MSEVDRAMVGELTAKRVDSKIDTYIEIEQGWLDQIAGTGKTYNKVGPVFFGAAINEWNATRSEKTTALDALRAVAEETAT